MCVSVCVLQVLQFVVHETTLPVTSAPSLDIDYSCMELPFCGLHCGVYHGKANGPIAVTLLKCKDGLFALSMHRI